MATPSQGGPLKDLHHLLGHHLTAALRTQYPPETLPIVALTAAAFEEDRERCQRVGMNDFVTKPVSAERLRAVLVKWKDRGAWSACHLAAIGALKSS